MSRQNIIRLIVIAGIIIACAAGFIITSYPASKGALEKTVASIGALPGCSETGRMLRPGDVDAITQLKVTYSCDGTASNIAHGNAVNKMKEQGFQKKSFDYTDGRPWGPLKYYEYHFGYDGSIHCVGFEFDPRRTVVERAEFDAIPLTGYTMMVAPGTQCTVSDGAPRPDSSAYKPNNNNPTRTDTDVAFDRVSSQNQRQVVEYHNFAGNAAGYICPNTVVKAKDGRTASVNALTGKELMDITLNNYCIESIVIKGDRPMWL